MRAESSDMAPRARWNAVTDNRSADIYLTDRTV